MSLATRRSAQTGTVNPLLAAYGQQTLAADDIAAVQAALQADYLTTGPRVSAFEEALADVTTAPAAVVCSSGTAALHLAYTALGIGAGDRVIVPAITFVATANAVRMCGAEVIFADVEPTTGLITPETAAAALRASRAQALVAVHLNGQSCDLQPLAALAKQHGCKLVTDACHALGGTYHNTKIGACVEEDMATFSFHPVKAITTGEGGAVTCKTPAAAEKLRILRSHGLAYQEDGVSGYAQTTLGYNYRLSDLQCALGLTQLTKLARFIAQRTRLAEIYTEHLAALSSAVQPPVIRPDGEPAWHLYAVRLAEWIDRRALRQQLRTHGIGTQVHYQPVHTQPYYQRRYGKISLPGAEAYAARTLSLPLHPQLTPADIRTVCDTLQTLLEARHD